MQGISVLKLVNCHVRTIIVPVSFAQSCQYCHCVLGYSMNDDETQFSKDDTSISTKNKATVCRNKELKKNVIIL